MLIVAILLSTFSSTIYAEGSKTDSGSCGTDATWTLSEDGTLTITGTGKIECDPFYEKYQNDIKHIIIGEGITVIGYSVFWSLYELLSVELPDGLTEIEDYAFSTCINLRSVELPETLKTIRYGAFFNSGLETVKIPDSVTTIERNAFGCCFFIKGIYTGRNITTITMEMMRECSKLNSVFIGKKVKLIESYAFNLSDNIETIYFEGTQEEWNSITIQEGNKPLENAEIVFNCTDSSYGVMASEEYDEDLMLAYTITFGNVEITGVNWDIAGDVVIPETIKGCPVTRIEDYSMDFLPDIINISLPKTLKYIGMPFMNQCFNVENIYVDEENEYYSSIDGNLFNKDGTVLLRYAIGNYREEYTIPAGVTKIENAAFSRIYNQLRVNIPESVTEIVKDALCEAHGIYHINVSENNPNYSSEDGVLFNKDKSTLICFPAAKGDIIHTEYDGNYVTHAREYTIPDSVKTIAPYAFSACGYLQSVTIPDSVESIGMCAFEGCSALEQIDLPDSITTIENFAFRRSGLKSITISDAVTYVGVQSFWDCENLEEINLPDSLRFIGEQAFYSTPYYENADNWENNTLYIGNHLIEVSEDYKDTHFDVKENTQCIGEYAFSFTDNIRSITLPDSLKALSNSAFAGCTKLESISIPEGITEINDYTFYLCKSMTEISIPKSVTEIDEYAFFMCNISYINYAGTQQDWNAIDINETGNEGFLYALIRFADGTVSGADPDEPTTVETTTEESTTAEITTISPSPTDPVTEPTTAKPSPTDPTTEIATENEEIIINDETISVDESIRVITVDTNRNADYVADAISNDNFEITDKDGNALESTALVGTGAKIIIKDSNGDIINEYTVVVPADIDGSGKITAADARLALRASAKIDTIDGVYAFAADATGDGRITAADARAILRKAAGLE